MLGHRALNLDDYLSIVKRRWWIISIPAIILPIVAVAATFLIPPQYVSETLVLIDQQKVPDEFVRSVVTEDLSSRLASMKEQILSRSSVEPIILKYNLYASEHLTMDGRLDLTRKAIRIETIASATGRSNGVPGFKIYFTANDPHTAQQVCSDITSLFTGANVRSREDAALGTTNYLKEELDDAKRNLDAQGAQLAAFQKQYFGMLPGDEKNNVDVMDTLNTQLTATTEYIQNLEQNKSFAEASLQQLQQYQATPALSATVQTPQFQQKQLDDLLAREEDLKNRVTAESPELKSVERQIADLRKQMESSASATPPVAPAAAVVNRQDSPEIQKLKLQIRGFGVSLDAKRKEQEQIQQQIRTYEGRIQSTPEVAEKFEELTRDTKTSQAAYDALNAELNQTKMATDLEHRQQGETFRVLDDSNVPDSPTFPKRNVFAMGGLAAGLGLGVLIVALLEYRDTALQTERDVWAFTQLPTLAVIAWSGGVAETKPGLMARLKGTFKRKPKKLLADVPG